MTTNSLYPTDAIQLIFCLLKNCDRSSTWRSTAQTLDITLEECKRARGLRESRGLDAVFPHGYGRDGYMQAIDSVLDKYSNPYYALLDVDQIFEQLDLQLEGCTEVLREASESDEITDEQVDSWLKTFKIGLARAYRSEAKPGASKR